MKTYLECFPCLLRQALEAARMAQADEGQQRAILNRVMELLAGVSADSAPAETSCHVHRTVREMTGVKDPYRLVSVLYLADNAGETVFDRVLIETLEQPVIYAVKGSPALNDATWEDAVAAGIEEVAEIVSTGSDAPGTFLDYCSPAFRQLYDEAELIIAKGQATHEALGEGDHRLFFLLQVKCPVLGREIGVEPGNIVLKQG